MDRRSNINPSSLREKIETLVKEKKIPHKYGEILKHFLHSYQEVANAHGADPASYLKVFDLFVDLTKEHLHAPFQFEPYHQKIRSPIDYYAFGLDFLRPLVDLPGSTLSGLENLDRMESFLSQKENVVLFANHQIEADPQAISLLLEKSHPTFGEELIFVAGTRVTTDPLAIPFSMGRNLLCIHSKKYIDTPPEEKYEKQLHNKRTMERMAALLSDGGHAIYVAPSGGRDRVNQEGIVELSPFDSQSIEMFYLMAKRASRPTHFFPLALSTYHLLPPPETTTVELGESRTTRGSAIHLHFGEEVDIESIPCSDPGKDKREMRKERADYFWHLVNNAYQQFPR